jgi:hypothetical protein
MKMFMTRAALLIAAVLIIAPLVAQKGNALSDSQLSIVGQNCSGIQLSLQELQKRDAVSRINRGRAYDQLLREVTSFNSRLDYNKINLPQLVQISNDLQTNVDGFRSAYSRYDEQLDNAIKSKCKDDPLGFYNTIVKARNQREIVGAAVTTLENLEGQYKDELVRYQDTLKAPTQGGTQ